MKKEASIDFFKRVQARFKLNPVWSDLFKSVSRVMDEEVEVGRRDLLHIRDPKRFHRGDTYAIEMEGKRIDGVVNQIRQKEDGTDEIFVQLPNNRGVFRVDVDNYKPRDVLVDAARNKGFNHFSSTLTTRDYSRVVEWIEQFYPHASDDNFVRFIGFVKNLDLSMFQLWSQESTEDNYPWMEERPVGISDVSNGGTVYPTSHVVLNYNATISSNPGDDLAHLFYMLAPIHLVLQRINAEINADLKYTFIAASDITMIQSGVLNIPD